METYLSKAEDWLESINKVTPKKEQVGNLSEKTDILEWLIENVKFNTLANSEVRDSMKSYEEIHRLLQERNDEVNERKAKRNGEDSLLNIVTEIIQEFTCNGIENLLVVRKLKDGVVLSSWYAPDGLVALGLTEVLRATLIEEITYTD